jgi:hypothetical protein
LRLLFYVHDQIVFVLIHIEVTAEELTLVTAGEFRVCEGFASFPASQIRHPTNVGSFCYLRAELLVVLQDHNRPQPSFVCTWLSKAQAIAELCDWRSFS